MGEAVVNGKVGGEDVGRWKTNLRLVQMLSTE